MSATTVPVACESHYDTQPVLVTWNGNDADDASLTYGVVALQGSTKITIATGLVKPVGAASISSTPPQVAAVTAYRIPVTAHDGGTPSLSVVDTSDADFAISLPPQMVNLATQLQPIFNASCTSAHCQDANQPQLNLTAGVAYTALVNVNSTQAGCASYKLVLPGQPDQSYLIFKLAGGGACFTGSRIPKTGSALSLSQRQLFRDWIANGAPNN